MASWGSFGRYDGYEYDYSDEYSYEDQYAYDDYSDNSGVIWWFARLLAAYFPETFGVNDLKMYSPMYYEKHYTVDPVQAGEWSWWWWSSSSSSS